MSAKKISIPDKRTKADEWVQGDPRASTRTAPNPGRFKRLTLDLPEDLHRAIKRHAVDQGKTMVEVLRALLEKKFGSHKQIS